VVVLLLQCIPAGPQHLSLYFEGCLGIFLRWERGVGDSPECHFALHMAFSASNAPSTLSH
jgi:hypothetical protein